MPFRLLRFRLRTILVAMVVIGLVASRCRFQTFEDVTGRHHWLFVNGMEWSGIGIYRQGIAYYDKAGTHHDISGLFTFATCPCCGQSWRWDGERYLE